MVNVTMLVHNRPELTRQSVESLYENTSPEDFDLTVLNDASGEETQAELRSCQERFGFSLYHNKASEGTGIARNKVASLVREHREWLYYSDNDVYFLPNWLDTLVESLVVAEEVGVIALGAYNHPYNPPFAKRVLFTKHGTQYVGLVHALATQSWLWRWVNKDRFGPFVTTPVGHVRQSEDFEMSQRVRAVGSQVAVLVPPKVVNTSITDSFGSQVPGAELILQEPSCRAYRL